MKPIFCLLFLSFCLVGCSKQESGIQSSIPIDSTHTGAQEKAQERPNILVIVADDLGYSDLGMMGSEINTPNLDALASSGKLLTNFHVSPTCSPTRAMLLSGNDNHRNGFGSMFGLTSAEQNKQPGYETYFNNHVVSIAALLKDAGYHTYMAGKWHVGLRPPPDLDKLHTYSDKELKPWRDTLPEARGFEAAHYILQGGSSHFGKEGLQAKEPYSGFMENGQPVDLPNNFYSSRFYTDKLIEYIDKNKEDGQPFFAYAAYTAPHWPLHAPDEFIEKYANVYDVGYEVIQQQRLTKLKQLGIISAATEAHSGPEIWPSWDELAKELQQREAKKMQVYAAMVDALDHHIGRLIDYLKASGAYDNTFILFFSDNGAEGNNPYDLPGNTEWIPARFDNTLENIGRHGSYIAYGPGWARVSSTPFRMYKGFVAEGGITTPAIAVYPNRIPASVHSSQFASVLDVAPTLLELAHAPHPGTQYQGREVLPLQGTSMLSALTNKTGQVHPDDFVMGFELFNRRAIRKGNWKLLLMNKPWGSGAWELFNLQADPAEQHNQIDKHPEIAQQLLAEWQQYKKENGVIEMDELNIKFTNGTTYYEQQE